MITASRAFTTCSHPRRFPMGNRLTGKVWKQSHGRHAAQTSTQQCSRCSPVDNDFEVLRCQGLGANEVLYLRPKQQTRKVSGYVVFFPGDAQDLHHRMVAAGHGDWAEYSLENTARMLTEKFGGQGVFAVLPSRHVEGGLASFNNFTRTDRGAGGAVPEYIVEGSACVHLQALLNSAANAINSASDAEIDTNLPLTLVGFSKGAVVLNQLVTELAQEAQLSTHPQGNGDISWERSPDRYSRKRPRAGSKKHCSACGTADPENDMVRASGSDGFVHKSTSIGEQRGGNNCEWSWSHEDDSGSDDVDERPKKGARGLERVELPEDRSEQEIEGWTNLSASTSRRTLSVASQGSTTDESQAHHDSDGGGVWKCTDFDAETNSDVGYATESVDTHIREPSEIPWTKLAADKTIEASEILEPAGLRVANGRGRKHSAAASRLFDKVTAVHWIDGGNGDLTKSFPDNEACLKSLASRRRLRVHVHGTPYQWKNPSRPWLSDEKEYFLAKLKLLRQDHDARERESFAREGGWDSSVRRKELAGCGGDAACAVNMASVCGVGVAKSDRKGEDDTEVRTASGRAVSDVDVRSCLYFDQEEPSLDVHFAVLREFRPQ